MANESTRHCAPDEPRDGLDEAALDAVNTRIVQMLRAEAGAVPSTARIQGSLAIRPCFVNPATNLTEVDTLADSVISIGDRCSE